MRGSVKAEIGALFAILFFWRVPTFSILRVDYGCAGFCVLPSVDGKG
jgi:hypothetical protein